MSFRENLKSELSFQGILVKELSAKTGIKKRTLDNYLREKGSIPPADFAVKIASALDVSVEFLVTGKDRKIKTQNIELFPADVRLISEKISKLDVNDRKLIRVLVDELETQRLSKTNITISTESEHNI